MVTSGGFTEEATAFAAGRNVTLIDGPKLFGMIQMARASISSTPASAPRREPEELVKTSPMSESPPVTAETIAPACPVCSRAMTIRTAKRGANVGGTFWGCTGYPACRGVRQAP